MNPALLLLLVLLASFGLVSLLLSSLVALAWRAGVRHITATSADLMALRLLPGAGGLLVVFTVVLPAFLAHEPDQQQEAAGPLLVMLAAYSLICVAHGVWRGWRACVRAYALLRDCGPRDRRITENGKEVHLLDGVGPLAAVFGLWHPRIVMAETVRSTCTGDEFRQVIAHEVAHIRAKDNLKLLLLVAAPDALAWTPLGATLTAHWRAAAECDADRWATGDDPAKRVALASAVVKLARLCTTCDGSRRAFGMSVAADDVAGRVRQLLNPPVDQYPARIVQVLAFSALLAPLVALPLHEYIHDFVERMVRFML